MTLARLRSIATFLAALLTLGCQPDPPAPVGRPAERPLAGMEIRLLVVDDPPLATAFQRLRGEWSVRTGGEFRVDQATSGQFMREKTIPGDAVICPSALLGLAAEQKLVRPLEGPEARAATAGVFELIRAGELTFGDRVFGVPFGSPTLVCYCRSDRLKESGRNPPQSWPEYLELARRIAVKQSASAVPLAPAWAGLTLLAWAAPYAKHRQNYSTLFDIDTMEPLVAGPPFVRALEELVTAARLGPAEQLDWGPADVRKAFWQGRCGLPYSLHVVHIPPGSLWNRNGS